MYRSGEELANSYEGIPIDLLEELYYEDSEFYYDDLDPQLLNEDDWIEGD